jgi:hypothetical protein
MVHRTLSQRPPHRKEKPMQRPVDNETLVMSERSGIEIDY